MEDDDGCAVCVCVRIMCFHTVCMTVCVCGSVGGVCMHIHLEHIEACKTKAPGPVCTG